MDYKDIKENYNRGIWKKELVAACVENNILTKEQFKSITNMDYDTYKKSISK